MLSSPIPLFRLTIDEENRRLLVQVAFEGFPSANVLTDNKFVLASEVAGYAKPRGRMEVFAKVLQHGVVAERCFDEQFRFVVGQ